MSQALNRKEVVLGLFKIAPKLKAVYDFLANDFSTPRYRQMAIKNAYSFVAKKNFGRFPFHGAGRLLSRAWLCV